MQHLLSRAACSIRSRAQVAPVVMERGRETSKELPLFFPKMEGSHHALHFPVTHCHPVAEVCELKFYKVLWLLTIIFVLTDGGGPGALGLWLLPESQGLGTPRARSPLEGEFLPSLRFSEVGGLHHSLVLPVEKLSDLNPFIKISILRALKKPGCFTSTYTLP